MKDFRETLRYFRPSLGACTLAFMLISTLIDGLFYSYRGISGSDVLFWFAPLAFFLFAFLEGNWQEAQKRLRNQRYIESDDVLLRARWNPHL